MSTHKFLEAVEDNVFDERPVDLNTFLYSEDYLNLPPLSHYQETIVAAMTQIYRYEELCDLWGFDEAQRLWEYTCSEITLMLGKGSGKDMITAIAFARVVYLLLCLKSPARYYGKPLGNSIDILNIAINAKQARNVFFKEFKHRIETCVWFDGKYTTRIDDIAFDKNVTAYSGHSEREGWEGYNFILVALDEIAGFATEAESDGGQRDGKTAEAIYETYSATVASRFPEFGKVCLLSFPRFAGDFIHKHYNEVVASKKVIERHATIKMKEEMLDGIPGNEITITWEEDHIEEYSQPGVYALRRPTWDINPLIKVEHFKRQFFRDKRDSLGRFACMPPKAVSAFFTDEEQVRQAFPRHRPPPFTDTWRIRESLQPIEGQEYFMHVDLAYKHDRAAVAMSHVSDWVNIRYSSSDSFSSPRIKLDAVRWWTPGGGEVVTFKDIENFILNMKRRGFDLRLVTFDRWGSVQFRQILEDTYGIETDNLSVAKPHYEDLKLCISEGRLIGYHIPLAVDELLELQVIKGNKIDHHSKSSKDVSDAIAGSVYNAIVHTYFDSERVVEAEFLSTGDDVLAEPGPLSKEKRAAMPADLKNYLESLQVL